MAGMMRKVGRAVKNAGRFTAAVATRGTTSFSPNTRNKVNNWTDRQANSRIAFKTGQERETRARAFHEATVAHQRIPGNTLSELPKASKNAWTEY